MTHDPKFLGEALITERLSREVAASLWAVYHERPAAPRLIWPAKRDDSTRVSEQESKILITQWLERNSVFYSVETPTREMYTQKGNAALSARIDVTVYGSRDPGDRVLNLELKAGIPSLLRGTQYAFDTFGLIGKEPSCEQLAIPQEIPCSRFIHESLMCTENPDGSGEDGNADERPAGEGAGRSSRRKMKGCNFRTGKSFCT